MLDIKAFYDWLLELQQERLNEHLKMVRRDETKYKLSIISGEIRMLDTIRGRLENDLKS